MAQENDKIYQYFPGIKIRTMTSDLERLKQGGGTLIEENEDQPREKTDFLFEETKPNETEIKPPSLDSASPQPPPVATPTPLATAPSGLTPTKTKEETSPLLIILTLVLGLIFLGSLGFWFVYPEISRRLSQAKLPSPTPSPTEQPTPTPSPISPSIKLANAEKVNLVLEKQTPQELLRKVQIETLTPRKAGSLVVYELINSQGKYLTSTELVELISPDALASFKAAPDETYLLFSYWLKENEVKTGIVLSLRPETLAPTKAIMKSWETANVEDYFPIVFLPDSPPKRGQESFKDVIINSIPVRKIKLGFTEFLYGFSDPYLILTTNEEVFKTITLLLK